MEDTQQNREALIAEMLRDAKTTEIPSELRTSPIIHRGDETLEAPMTVKELSSAGYVWIFDTRSYERIPLLYYMLPSKLRQRRQDGSFRFTTTDPKKLPARGALKCLLHPEGEERKHYDSLGFRTCLKGNLLNAYQRQQHMVKKHPQEWATIDAERKEKERAEDRELQRLLIKGQLGKVKKETDPDKVFPCEVCNKSFTSRIALAGHKRSHLEIK